MLPFVFWFYCLFVFSFSYRFSYFWEKKFVSGKGVAESLLFFLIASCGLSLPGGQIGWINVSLPISWEVSTGSTHATIFACHHKVCYSCWPLSHLFFCKFLMNENLNENRVNQYIALKINVYICLLMPHTCPFSVNVLVLPFLIFWDWMGIFVRKKGVLHEEDF